jgi:hypothetical protein
LQSARRWLTLAGEGHRYASEAQMTDSEVLQVIIQIAQLRSNPTYRHAELRRRQLGPEGAAIMARAPQDSPDYAALRQLVGTWNRIAIFVEAFSGKQRQRFFHCHPIALTWKVLKPGIEVIRHAHDVAEPVHKNYAWQLEDLAGKYEKWLKTADGKDYRTEAQQAVCADFG